MSKDAEFLRIVFELNFPYPLSYMSSTVQLGSIDRNSGIFIRTRQLFIHEGFNLDTFTDDIAMLQLARAVVFSASIKAINVEISLSNLSGKTMRVSGFGFTNTNMPSSQMLLFTDVVGISAAACQPFYWFPITGKIQCTRSFKNVKNGVCQGDR